MGISVSDLVGGQDERIERMLQALQFNTHVAIPCVVQSFNATQRTVECQPTIRERVINEDNVITYVNYPVLVNVPVCFPQSTNAGITFPISRGDECIVLFQDGSIDNWWLKGNVQNPVEQRRHDLSDGIAIFGVNNQSKQQIPYNANALTLSYKNNVVKITENDVIINGRSMNSAFALLDSLRTHTHIDSLGGSTSGPQKGGDTFEDTKA